MSDEKVPEKRPDRGSEAPGKAPKSGSGAKSGAPKSGAPKSGSGAKSGARKSGGGAAGKGTGRLPGQGGNPKGTGAQPNRATPSGKSPVASPANTVKKATRAASGNPSAVASLALEEAKKAKHRVATLVTVLCCGAALILGMSVFSSSMGMAGSEAGGGEKSGLAASQNGVTPVMRTGLAQRTEGTKVPWQIPAAINKTAAVSDEGEGWGGFDMKAVKKTKDKDLRRAVKNDDDEFIILWIIRRLHLSVDGHAGTSLALDSGASSSGMDRFIAAGSPGPSAEVEAIWTQSLEALPLSGNPERAEEVFLLARTWALGNFVNECGFVENVSDAPGATSGWGNPTMGRITSEYGMRYHPTLHVNKLHDGTDIGAPAGAPVHAAASGTAHVVSAAAYGQHFVTIDHGDGLQTQYGHMSASSVTEGQEVQAGDKIGEVGSQGYSTGPHLHFIVRENGSPTDPVPFMKEKGVDLGATPVGQLEGGQDNGSTPVENTGTGSVPAGTSGSKFSGELTVATANIPAVSGYGGYRKSIAKISGHNPEIITVNEAFAWSNAQIAVSGYAAYRPATNNRQLRGNAVLYKADKWEVVTGGRIRLVEADRTIHKGKKVNWKWRHATWAVLKRKADGAVLPVISAHLPTNPKRGAQWGKNKYTRPGLYGEAMRRIGDLVSDLGGKYGPVVVAGDMNTHVSQRRPWTAANRMKKLGYAWASHSVDYVFYPTSAATLNSQVSQPMVSDHQFVVAKMTFNGTGSVALPESWTGTSSAGEKVTLDRTQLGFAQKIMTAGRERGVSDDGIIIAFMTVFPETKGTNAATAGKAFNNYASNKYPVTVGKEYPKGAIGSDRDSVGLFQQRPQAGWGEPTQLMDPTYAAQAFFGGPEGPNGGSPMGLLDHAGWESRPKGEVAQDIQVSGHPDRYAEWETPARELLSVVASATVVDAADECAPQEPEHTEGFTVATLNVLGEAKAEPGSTRAGKYPRGSVRFSAAMDLLQEKSVSIAALQEMHVQNEKTFRNNYTDAWGYCSGVDDYVVWRKSEWREVQCGQVDIPYSGGRDRAQPFVLLEQVSTGEKLWFMGVNNPANGSGPAGHRRQEALEVELKAVKQREKQGFPVFIAGDFNDAQDGANSSQCVLTPYMTNAFGSPGQGCGRPDGDPPGDHIYSKGVTLAEATEDRDATRRISDHPLVTAVVPGQTSGGNCTPQADNPIASNGAYAPNAVKLSHCMYGSFNDYISTIGGYRASSRSGNHERGCALDIMIKDWETAAGKTNGAKIAKWVQDNAEQMGAQYVIWDQKIWSTGRAAEGWRPMSDRGSPTQNHLDHVHVSVTGPQCVVEV